MKAKFLMSLMAVAILVATEAFAAPKKPTAASKQTIQNQIVVDEVKSLKAEIEKLSLQVEKLSEIQTQKPVTLVADANTVASDATPSTSIATVASETDHKFVLGIDLRPTYYVKPENVGSENTITAGIQFTKDTSLIYEQYVDTVVGGTETVGAKPKMRDGAARVLVNNLWQSKKLGLSFSYENRSLLPFDVDKTASARIIENRNYLKLKKDFGNGIAVSVMETPVFFAYSKSQDGQATFENRFYIVPEASLLENKLSIGFPIWVKSTTARTGDASHQLLAWPEVTYAVASGIELGAAFYTDNLMNSNFGGLNISNGLDNGAAQMVLRASL